MAPRIYFRHFLSDSPALKAFHEAVGRNVVLWGRFEATIDHTLLTIMHHEDAREPPQVIPTSFKAKMDFWKKLFKAEPSVAQLSERALRFAADAKHLAESRNSLIHASIGSVENGEARSFGYKLERDGRVLLRQQTLTTKKLQKLEKDTIALYSRLSVFATHAMLQWASQTGRERSPQQEGADAAQ